VSRTREWPGYEFRMMVRSVLRRILITLFIALVAAAPAAAGNIVVHLGLTPGKLSVASAPASLSAGATKQLTVRVADGRGTGKGWTLRFAEATGLQVTGINAHCASNSTCTLPSAVGTPGGATVLQSLHDTGMGIIDLTVTVRATAAASVAFAVS
jgi:hypothetical protein